jgi:hypothetical protein
MANPLWKLRLPLPAFPGWQNISMPLAREHAEGEGLSFWTRYMNPSRLAEIQAALQAAELEKERAQVEINTKGREEAKADIEHNPGFARE